MADCVGGKFVFNYTEGSKLILQEIKERCHQKERIDSTQKENWM